MKKRNNKTIATLYYVSSICFYLISIISFIEKNSTAMGIIFLGLGSTYLCLGSAYVNKQKNEEKENNQNK